MNRCIKIFVGGPNECIQDMREVISIIRQIDPPGAEFTLEPFCWNMEDSKVLPPSKGSIQRRIDAGPVNPTNCDIMIMLFRDKVGSPCRQDGVDYPSWSAYEIETTLCRARNLGADTDNAPKVYILENEFEAPDISYNLPREERRKKNG